MHTRTIIGVSVRCDESREHESTYAFGGNLNPGLGRSVPHEHIVYVDV